MDRVRQPSSHPSSMRETRPLFPESAEPVLSSNASDRSINSSSPALSNASTSVQEESRREFRARSIETILDAEGDVGAFLEELDVKRKQLDDQIHRYVKQKDREFKLFERDLRMKYRPVRKSSFAQHNRTDDGQLSQSTARGSSGHSHQTPLGPGSQTNGNRDDETNQSQRSNGMKDTKSSRERESELLGLFTPTYISLLDNEVEPSSSSPSTPSQLLSASSHEQVPRETLQRAYSDPVVKAESDAASVRLTAAKRTSSSGYEPSRGLVSVLRSNSSSGRFPKGKRVSLVVGDEIVTPSDDVSHVEPGETIPAADAKTAQGNPAANGRMSHSVEKPTQPTVAALQPKEQIHDSTPLRAEHVEEVSQHVPQQGGPAPPMISALSRSFITEDETKDMDFDSPFAMDEDDAAEADPRKQRRDDLMSEGENTPSPPGTPTRAQPMPRSPMSTSFTRSPSGPRAILSSSLSQMRTASSSSLQPASPGFSRPSVDKDPQFDPDHDWTTPEIQDNQSYGSFSRSSSYLDGGKGSLGESYMQRNAELMMKKRQSSGHSAR